MPFRSRLPRGAVLMTLVLLCSHSALRADIDIHCEPLGGRSLAALKLSALKESPRLASARARIAQAESDVRELRLYPNPTLQVEGEELPADWSTGPGLLLTSINQSIVTGGKRRYRVRSARAAVNRAVREYEHEALELARDVTKAYVDILAARRRLQVAHRLAQLAPGLDGDGERQGGVPQAAPEVPGLSHGPRSQGVGPDRRADDGDAHRQAPSLDFRVGEIP